MYIVLVESSLVSEDTVLSSPESSTGVCEVVDKDVKGSQKQCRWRMGTELVWEAHMQVSEWSHVIMIAGAKWC